MTGPVAASVAATLAVGAVIKFDDAHPMPTGFGPWPRVLAALGHVVAMMAAAR